MNKSLAEIMLPKELFEMLGKDEEHECNMKEDGFCNGCEQLGKTHI